jgi:restriction endonuclease S subunit
VPKKLLFKMFPRCFAINSLERSRAMHEKILRSIMKRWNERGKNLHNKHYNYVPKSDGFSNSSWWEAKFEEQSSNNHNISRDRLNDGIWHKRDQSNNFASYSPLSWWMMRLKIVINHSKIFFREGKIFRVILGRMWIF